MKKPLLVLFLLFCCSLAPAAILCSSCGKDMPDKANFCPWCGTALPEATKPDQQVAREVSTPAGSVPIELSPSDYNYVSQMETMINANNHAVASRETAKFRTLHDRQMTAVAPHYGSYNAY
ncbi:MAG: zinc ribbon domain-containing protein, partial [Candidatus Riflebacteria bacterium]|nr:zinc ribbon domain-containing protein [Candidatus Riflebacteria bacterium]